MNRIESKKDISNVDVYNSFKIIFYVLNCGLLHNYVSSLLLIEKKEQPLTNETKILVDLEIISIFNINNINDVKLLYNFETNQLEDMMKMTIKRNTCIVKKNFSVYFILFSTYRFS